MSRFRLLAFDLDGTLLEPGGGSTGSGLSEESCAFLRGLSARGIEPVAATGRRLHSALPHLRRAGLAGRCVVHNGAQVAEITSEATLHADAIAPTTLTRLLTAFAERGFSPLLFTAAPKGAREIVVERDAADPTGFRKWYFDYAKGHFTFVPRLVGAELPEETWLRAVVHGDREELERLVLGLTGTEASPAALGRELRGFVQRETFLATHRAEFLARGATKWSGIQFVARALGIAPAEIVAVGDESNDVELLGGAGYSLAAPGASESARRAAREVIEDPAGGPRAVVRALERLLA